MLVCLITRNIFIDIKHNNAKRMLGTFYFIPSRGQRHWRFHHNGFLMKHYIGWMFCHLCGIWLNIDLKKIQSALYFFRDLWGFQMHQLWESLFVSRVFQGGCTVSKGKLWNVFFFQVNHYSLFSSAGANNSSRRIEFYLLSIRNKK